MREAGIGLVPDLLTWHLEMPDGQHRDGARGQHTSLLAPASANARCETGADKNAPRGLDNHTVAWPSRPEPMIT